MAGIVEQTGEVAKSAIQSMSGVPLAIALLCVNALFLGLMAYILGEVSANAGERNKAQLTLINDLVHDIRDCRGGVVVPRQPGNTQFNLPLPYRLDLIPVSSDPPLSGVGHQ
jgi:hypothetical protein